MPAPDMRLNPNRYTQLPSKKVSTKTNKQTRVKVRRFMLLAKIEENKVYFGMLVTFLGERGVNVPHTYPLDPLEGVSRG